MLFCIPLIHTTSCKTTHGMIHEDDRHNSKKLLLLYTDNSKNNNTLAYAYLNTHVTSNNTQYK